jgi:hypothetical protein
MTGSTVIASLAPEEGDRVIGRMTVTTPVTLSP